MRNLDIPNQLQACWTLRYQLRSMATNGGSFVVFSLFYGWTFFGVHFLEGPAREAGV